MNVCDVQTYSINKRLIIFLNSRPYTGFPYGVTNVCNICHRSLPAGNFKFCCLSCKREAIYHRFAKQTFAVETNLGTCELNDSFQIDQSLTPEKKLKIRRLNKLVAKSSVASTSVAKQVASIICPPAVTMFNHVNSRKRKGIPRRAPLT
ncbi:hypothetical protein RHGRI_001397 [Rhododendron griersonianum]|uniref:PLATZ transcription factor family protein n=1 Tax=Rhododendron griersonianum TaxID=479676 RepID=A0AAV6LL86_9ERIC|nr:hypothetical protein RHGRI_001397 [Rhododendron griersonianum]